MSLGEWQWMFLRPAWLLALLPLALALWRRRRVAGGEPGRAGEWANVVAPHLLPHLLRDVLPTTSPRRSFLPGVAICLGVLALSGPAVRLPETSLHLARPALTRVLLIDLSPVFGALSVATQEQVRFALRELLPALAPAETALVVYGEEPYLVIPPTTDPAAVDLWLPELVADAIPLPGDRPERALRLAGEVLARSGARQLEILWVSPAPPQTLAAVLQRTPLPAGSRVALLPVAGEATPVSVVTPDPAGLVTLPFVPGAGNPTALAARLAIATAGDSSAPVQAAGVLDLGPYLLLILLPLAAWLLRGRLAAGAAGTALVAVLLVASMPRTAEADGGADNDSRWQAVARYRAGDYAAAAALLAPLRDADSLYNRGNALAHLGRLGDALALYNAALEQRPNDPDYRYNRDLLARLMKSPPAGGGSSPPAAASSPEADRVAEQWLRRVPDRPMSSPGQPGLLHRKLSIEHQRRLAGQVKRPW